MTTNVPAFRWDHATKRPTGRRVVRRRPVGLNAFVGRSGLALAPSTEVCLTHLATVASALSVSPPLEVVVT